VTVVRRLAGAGLLACLCLPTAALSQADDEIAAAKARLGPVQLLSFATKREYCGYLVRDSDGVIGFTEMVRGGPDGCSPVLPGANLTAIASLHTHGAYDPTVPAEFPTTLDMDSDAAEGVNGYVATPGGRLWFIDSAARIAIELCTLNCLPQDSGFRPGDDGQIARRYTYKQLQALEATSH
jgi:hypothetical protein